MSACTLSQELIQKTIDFHGHWCPGLAIGVRAAEWALTEMGKSADEEIVAVVETDMCGVDAIQFLTSCTFGKGNLIYKDYGKNAFSFYRREDEKAMRLIVKSNLHGDAGETLGRLHRKMSTEGLTPEEEEEWKDVRAMISSRVMKLGLTDIFDIKATLEPLPKKARILASLVCDSCGETAMETRTRRMYGKTLCLSCFNEQERR